MTPIREKIIRAFRVCDEQAGVRELLTRHPLRGAARASVSKECRYMARLGFLKCTRANNGQHGKRYLFQPTALLHSAGELPVCVTTVMLMLNEPLTNKDLRYGMASACGERVSRRSMQVYLDRLLTKGKIEAVGGHSKYPRYVKIAAGGRGISLADVCSLWAASRRGVRAFGA